MCTKSVSGSAFRPELLDLGTILFSFHVQNDFSMIADEDAKDKLSVLIDIGASAVMGRTQMTVLVEKLKVYEKTVQLN